jgi:ubiquinone/menaquinone biosynthesis C-methylase UbiE
MAGVSSQHDIVRREFTRQSAEFAAADSFFGSRRLAEWIAARLPLTPDAEVLDLAGGAGHLSRALASRARRFVVLDLTPQQLATGREAVAREGIANVEFVEGDAARTAFPDASFDLVMSRFALHHVPDAAAVVREAGRVCRPGGHVALVDMVVPDDEAVAGVANELERLRDPSHTTALSASALEALAAGQGDVVARDERDGELPVAAWLERAATPPEARDQVVRRLREELEGGAPTGLRPRAGDDGLAVTQRWLLLVVRRG